MNLAELASEVCGTLRARSAELDLEPDRVTVEYVLNWGGFVNRSFRVSDGRKQLHLKLSDDPETHEAFRLWSELGPALEQYHAPPVVGWVELPTGRFAGLLTGWIDGRAPERVTRDLAERVLPVVARLHGDAELARRLASVSGATTCAETYLATYGERFREDFDEIARFRPPFVTDAALRLMRDETTRLEDEVRRSAAFREAPRSPIHSDLWTGNILLTADGRWFLLDWDDLTIGDPVLDFAMLLGPSASDLQPLDWSDLVDPLLASDARRERFAVYLRAQLLDWVIDSVADYVEADAAPEYVAEVRAEKQRLHREALDLYTTLYG